MLYLFLRILIVYSICRLASLRGFHSLQTLNMRTQVGIRRQQGSTEEEIEEIIIQGNNPPEEKIYVAVGKDLCESTNAVNWALQNLSNREETLIILLHVVLPLRYIPTPLGRIPVTQVTEDKREAFQRDRKVELNSRMQKYFDICIRAQVKAEILFAEKEHVGKGIVEVVSEKGVQKLIMGTTSGGGAISRRMRMRTRGIADYVRRHVMESCDVSIVCKDKVVLRRQGSSMDDDMPSKRSEWRTVEPSSENCTVSSRPSFGGRPLIGNQIPLEIAVKRDSTSSSSERVNDSQRTFTIDKDSFDSESVPSNFDEVFAFHTVQPQPQGGNQDALTDIETLHDKLRQSLKVAENVRAESSKECAKRKKAEVAAVKANYRIKELESAFKDKVKEKEEVEKNLASMAEKVNQISCERNEAILQLLEERKKLAAMALQNHRILQEKEAQMKLVQDCLHSRPPLETLPSTSSSSHNLEYSEHTFEEIKEATSNFSEHFKLGEGGYGIVYKGEIRRTTVAVKILRESSLQGRREFEREMAFLSDVRHPHLVRIVGACFEQGCILYEYMCNGSLADYVSSSKAHRPLSWQARIRIAAEICSALQYLHSFKPAPIVHRDLKPENILLDENYMSKISDFGLARSLPLDSHSESEPKGTFCYMDPEYLTSGQYSTKSDVYSLGIVMLQLVTGKPALRLVQEVKRAVESAKLEQMLDRSAGDWPLVQASQLVDLALQCTHRTRGKRPEIQPTVMKILNELRNLAVPVEGCQKGMQKSDEIHVPGFFLCPIFKARNLGRSNYAFFHSTNLIHRIQKFGIFTIYLKSCSDWQEVMRDPYVAADGFTYEKEAIQEWLDCGNDTSPMTNKKLVDKNLIPNFSLRSTIRQWEERGHLY